MTPRNRNLTDSQKELASIVADELASKPPTAGPQMKSADSAEMYEIAERVVGREEAGHMRRCEQSGPAKRLQDELDEVRTDVKTHERILSEIAGAQKLSRWLVPMVVSLASSALTLAMLKLMLGGVLGR